MKKVCLINKLFDTNPHMGYCLFIFIAVMNKINKNLFKCHKTIHVSIVIHSVTIKMEMKLIIQKGVAWQSFNYAH